MLGKIPDNSLRTTLDFHKDLLVSVEKVFTSIQIFLRNVQQLMRACMTLLLKWVDEKFTQITSKYSA
jgi:hypothetical protein